tara:strand:+ start:12 stop:443 length:432 start_codon:yes stop_codon:yes gene_type:complete
MPPIDTKQIYSILLLEEKKMIYNFDQNNSGGYYVKPAQNIIVKDARDEKHAIEIALKAGMYFNGVADGVDCDCCGDRWNGISGEYGDLDKAVANANDSFIDEHNGVPKYVIVDGGSGDSIKNWRVRGSNYYLDDLDISDTVLE